MAALHLADDKTAVQWLLKARQADRAYSFSALYWRLPILVLGKRKKHRLAMANSQGYIQAFQLRVGEGAFPPATQSLLSSASE